MVKRFAASDDADVLERGRSANATAALVSALVSAKKHGAMYTLVCLQAL